LPVDNLLTQHNPMSLSVYTKKSKEKLMLSKKPFASGGEGHLYKIIAPHSFINFVVKIYHSNKLTPTKEAKIDYLLEHPPKEAHKTSIVWVQDSIRDAQGNFLGFLMPFIKGEKLEILCTPKLPKKLANTWYRFHKEADDSLDLRLKVCYNLAAAVHQVHASKRYVLVDLKPDNVIITLDGLVSLVDLDSVEVVEDGQKLFDAPVATPEYTPPEYYKKNNAHDPTQQQAWDRFSMAVIFYKLLMGIHPFAGSFKAPYDTANNLAQKIEKHLFVYNHNISSYKRSIPPPHQSFYGLSDGLQRLFLEAFVEGSQQPELRPTAHVWCSAIMQHLDVHRFRVLPSKLIRFPNNQNLLDEIYQPTLAPSIFIDQLDQKTTEPLLANQVHPKESEATLLLFLRKINLSILIGGLTYGCSNIFFNNNLPISYLTLLIAFCSSVSIILFSFFYRQNNRKAYLLKISLSETLQFFQKQEQVFKGITEHLEQFWKQLNQEHRNFFPNLSEDKNNTIQIAVQEESNHLQEDLNLKDKTAKNLIQSEIFEYTTLKEKYNRALRINSNFSEASSLDAELAAIDFALQESMEDLQKTLGKELKSTQLEYDHLFEKEERMLQNLERSVQQKIGQYRKTTAQAKKQEEKKTLLKMKRQIQKDSANVTNNIATRISLFKGEIESFLIQHNIEDLNQIKDIKTSGIVTLEGGKKISIAPLKYYQIHELSEWWMAVKLGRIELSQTLKDQIDGRYEKQLSTYKKKLNTEFNKAKKSIIQRKESVQKEVTGVLKKLRSKNEPQVRLLKETYRLQKEFLNQIFDERNVEEREIHERYQAKFDALLEATQTRANATQKFIQKIYQVNIIEPKNMAIYKKNQAKYDLGLQRLTEEHQRLSISHARYKETKIQAQGYNEVDLLIHLQQMFFVAPVS
jgi:serine/threonine protein kinase/predicted nucleic acid-binding protein